MNLTNHAFLAVLYGFCFYHPRVASKVSFVSLSLGVVSLRENVPGFIERPRSFLGSFVLQRHVLFLSTCTILEPPQCASLSAFVR